MELVELDKKIAESTDYPKQEVPTETVPPEVSAVVSPPMDFDDLLPHIGEFGLYQKCLFLMMIPFSFFVIFVYFAQIFITLTPETHWCRVLELANLSLEERLALGIPVKDGAYENCRQYDVNFTKFVQEGVTQADPSWATVPCKNGWEFNLTEVPYESIAAELEWVCENATLPTIAQAIFFGGAIAGGFLFGWIADRWGRVPALVATNVVGFAAGVATATSTSFWMFCVYRFLVGLALDNCFNMMYILVLEYVGPKWRTFVANMSVAFFFAMSACLLPWIAYFLADWRLLCVATSVPLALAAVTPWIVPESARWLVSQGRFKEAVVILRKFERINKTKVPEGIYTRFEESCILLRKEEDSNKKYSVVDVFRSPRLARITVLLIIIWMVISLVYDGHVRNISQLGLDVFVTFTVASTTELPAALFLIAVLDRWGRRWLACGSMIVSGIFSLAAVVAPPGVTAASLAIMGRFSVNISFCVGLQYGAELLPTVVRAQGVALIQIMGNVASILAPFVVYLSVVHEALPLLILGVLGVIGGVLALFLPETLDQDLPQTLADGENFGINQRFFDFPCCNKKYLCSDLVYVLLFPQLLLAVRCPDLVNTYGSLASFSVGLSLRLLGGEPGLGLPLLVRYPLFDADTGEQRFPHRTTTMLVALAVHLLASAGASKFLGRGGVAEHWDVLKVFGAAKDVQQSVPLEGAPLESKSALDLDLDLDLHSDFRT